MMALGIENTNMYLLAPFLSNLKLSDLLSFFQLTNQCLNVSVTVVVSRDGPYLSGPLLRSFAGAFGSRATI